MYTGRPRSAFTHVLVHHGAGIVLHRWGLGQSTNSHNLPSKDAWTFTASNWATILLYHFSLLCIHRDSCASTHIRTSLHCWYGPGWWGFLPATRRRIFVVAELVGLTQVFQQGLSTENSGEVLGVVNAVEAIAKGKQTPFYLGQRQLEFSHRNIGDVDLCHKHSVRLGASK